MHPQDLTTAALIVQYTDCAARPDYGSQQNPHAVVLQALASISATVLQGILDSTSIWLPLTDAVASSFDSAGVGTLGGADDLLCAKMQSAFSLPTPHQVLLLVRSVWALSLCIERVVDEYTGICKCTQGCGLYMCGCAHLTIMMEVAACFAPAMHISIVTIKCDAVAS